MLFSHRFGAVQFPLMMTFLWAGHVTAASGYGGWTLVSTCVASTQVTTSSRCEWVATRGRSWRSAIETPSANSSCCASSSPRCAARPEVVPRHHRASHLRATGSSTTSDVIPSPHLHLFEDINTFNLLLSRKLDICCSWILYTRNSIRREPSLDKFYIFSPFLSAS